MFDQLMIDLETLGTSTDCPVISIGASWFDLKSKIIGNPFYMVLDIKDQIDSKIRSVDADTIKWWMNQSQDAKKVFRDNTVPTKDALEVFAKWILENAGSKAKTTKKCFPWGNGSSFDLAIMESMFRDYNVTCPWYFYAQRDLRTFKVFVGKGKKIEKAGTEHNALDDAVSQINYMFSCLE